MHKNLFSVKILISLFILAVGQLYAMESITLLDPEVETYPIYITPLGSSRVALGHGIKVKIFDINSGEKINEYPLTNSCKQIAGVGNNHIATIDIYGSRKINVFNSSTGEHFFLESPPSKNFRHIRTMSSNMLASTLNDGTILIWDITTGECLAECYTQINNPFAFAVIDNEHIAISNGCDFSIWNVNSGECINIFEGHTETIGKILVINATKLVTQNKRHNIIIWNWKNKEILFQKKMYLSSSISVLRNRYLVLRQYNFNGDYIHILDTETCTFNEELGNIFSSFCFKNKHLRVLDFPHLNKLITYQMYKEVFLWDVSTINFESSNSVEIPQSEILEECPICFEEKSSNLFMQPSCCNNKQIICNTCYNVIKKSNNTCPFCRGDFFCPTYHA